jgi:hypothetical protein
MSRRPRLGVFEKILWPTTADGAVHVADRDAQPLNEPNRSDITRIRRTRSDVADLLSRDSHCA